ncbi:MAG TPA: NAD(P)-binding protein [Verrucomicrobiae bacterium]|nr:NAD(P)-binding protein [Verrucomicrobiae bacterium]
MKPITIVGGGLAGLTAGIGLRQRNVPVTVLEAGRIPRHRVCGEFISGRGQKALERLGLHEIFVRAGAGLAKTAAFYSARFRGPVRRLPVPALCLTRFKMDALLAQRFVELGGELRENTRWREGVFGEGVVRTTGRKAQPIEDGVRWCGFKVHALRLVLEADLEMHLGADGYVGLCQLDDGRVNVCGLFRRPVAGAKGEPVRWQELLRGAEGSPLRERMAGVEFDATSFCAVAGLPIAPQRAQGRPECVLGDALTMIPPITGNGMSMAYEAAEAALDPLTAYSKGAMTWGEAQTQLARQLDETFASRLAWARTLQTLAFQPFVREASLALIFHSEWLWRLVFAKTR